MTTKYSEMNVATQISNSKSVVEEISLGEVQLCAEGYQEAACNNAASGHQCYEHRLSVPPGSDRAYLEAEDDCERRLRAGCRHMSVTLCQGNNVRINRVHP